MPDCQSVHESKTLHSKLNVTLIDDLCDECPGEQAQIMGVFFTNTLFKTPELQGRCWPYAWLPASTVTTRSSRRFSTPSSAVTRARTIRCS